MDIEHKRRILEAQEKAELMSRLVERGVYILGHVPLPDSKTVTRDEVAPEPETRLA